jgi:hypothetical protein
MHRFVRQTMPSAKEDTAVGDDQTLKRNAKAPDRDLATISGDRFWRPKACAAAEACAAGFPNILRTIHKKTL